MYCLYVNVYCTTATGVMTEFQYISNKMQIYTVYIWKLLYMFWLVPPPIIRSARARVCVCVCVFTCGFCNMCVWVL
jgi:hypothetical protein